MEEFGVIEPFNQRQKKSCHKKYWLIVVLLSVIVSLQIFMISSEYIVMLKEGNKMDETRGEVHDFIVFGHDFLFNASLNLDDLMTYVRGQTASTSVRVNHAVNRMNSLEHDVRRNMEDITTKFNGINQKVETMAGQVNHTMTVIDDLNQRFSGLLG